MKQRKPTARLRPDRSWGDPPLPSHTYKRQTSSYYQPHKDHTEDERDSEKPVTEKNKWGKGEQRTRGATR